MMSVNASKYTYRLNFYLYVLSIKLYITQRRSNAAKLVGVGKIPIAFLPVAVCDDAAGRREFELPLRSCNKKAFGTTRQMAAVGVQTMWDNFLVGRSH